MMENYLRCIVLHQESKVKGIKSKCLHLAKKHMNKVLAMKEDNHTKPWDSVVG